MTILHYSSAPEFFLSIAYMALVCIALLGYGRLTRGYTSIGSPSGAVTLLLGLGFVISLGGWINLLRLAHAWVFVAILASGVTLFLFQSRATPTALRKLLQGLRISPTNAFLTAAFIVLFVIIIGLQLTPKAFNFHDDFQKYFAHPVRMLQTGTLHGSPLNALGSQTLGGQAFLHGFILAFFPVRYLNGLDAVFGQALCLLLVLGFAWNRPERMPFALAAMLLIVLINPQYVNVSPLYMGSALIMASALFALGPSVDGGDQIPAHGAGLLYAALIALKPTFALYALLHVTLVVAAIALRDRRAAIAWAGKAAGWGTVYLLPWVLLHFPNYATAIFDPVAAPEVGGPVVEFPYVDFLSTTPLFYGLNYAYYTGLIVFLLAVVAFVPRTAAIGLAAASGYVGIIYLGGPLLSGPDQSLRYFIPVLIGTAPVALCGASLYFEAQAHRAGWLRAGFLCLALAVPFAAFAPDAAARLRQLTQYGSMLAFTPTATDTRYIDYNREVLYGDFADRVAAAQQAVPEGAPLIAWINAPFHLDYARQEISDINPAGLATPWSRRPNAQYLLIEYRGIAVEPAERYLDKLNVGPIKVRLNAAHYLAFHKWVREIQSSATVLFDDKGIATFKISATK